MNTFIAFLFLLPLGKNQAISVFNSIKVFTANQNIHAETENFVVDVTGNQNVPKYTFYQKSNDSTTYSVFFNSLYECTGGGVSSRKSPGDCKKYGPSNIALPSLDWSYSDVVETNQTVTFTITATSKGNNQQFSSLQFKNYLIKGNNTNSLKFDVIIQGYSWVSSDSNARLALGFSLQGAVDFDIATTAQSGNSLVNVQLADDEDGKKKYVIYDHFSGDLEHDPTIGIGAGSLITFSMMLVAFLLFL